MNDRSSGRRGPMAVAAVCLAVCCLEAAPNPKSIIVIQPSSPVGITNYKASFETQNNAGIIQHAIQYTNRSRNRIAAVRFGFIAFDAFNKSIGKIGGISMQDVGAGGKQSGNWTQSSPMAFSFLNAIAFVDTVRFEDGTMWQADDETLMDEVRKIDKEFDPKHLRD